MRTIKTLSLLFIAVIVLLSIFACDNSDKNNKENSPNEVKITDNTEKEITEKDNTEKETTENTTKREPLFISGTYAWKPIAFIDEDTKEHKGIAVDVARETAKHLGWKYKVDLDMPWNRLFPMLDEGELDVVAGVYWTEERAEKYLISEPFVEDKISIWVPKGKEFKFEKLEDLKGKTGGRPSGGSYGQEFDDFSKEHLTMEFAETQTELSQMLLNGRIDYLVLAYWDGMLNFTKDGIIDQVTALEKPVAVNNVHLCISKKSNYADEISSINETIKKMKSEGTIEKMMDDYLK